jgi:hypothetical protein
MIINPNGWLHRLAHALRLNRSMFQLGIVGGHIYAGSTCRDCCKWTPLYHSAACRPSCVQMPKRRAHSRRAESTRIAQQNR